MSDRREKDKFGDTFYWSILRGTLKLEPTACFQAQMAAISTGIFVFGGGANGILKQQKFYDYAKCKQYLTYYQANGEIWS